MRQTVPSYGFHEVGGVSIFAQDNGVLNGVGIDLGFPISVLSPYGFNLVCPCKFSAHDVSEDFRLGSLDYFHPVINAMLPIPNFEYSEPIVWKQTQKLVNVLKLLTWMSNPKHPLDIMMPIWMVSLSVWKTKAASCNALPLVITDCCLNRFYDAQQIAMAASYSGRRTIFLAKGDFAVQGEGTTTVNSVPSIQSLPSVEELKSIGGNVVGSYLRDNLPVAPRYKHQNLKGLAWQRR